MMTTTFTVKLFAALRQSAGTDTATVELAPGSTIAALLSALDAIHPELELDRRPVYAAVNAAYVTPAYVLQPGDAVALFPPVSGGSHSQTPRPARNRKATL